MKILDLKNNVSKSYPVGYGDALFRTFGK